MTSPQPFYFFFRSSYFTAWTIFLLCGVAYFYYELEESKVRSESTEATVEHAVYVRRDENRNVYRVTVAYIVQGERVSASLTKTGKSAPTMGKSLRVYYEPANPQNVSFSGTPSFIWLGLIVLAILGYPWMFVKWWKDGRTGT